MTDFDDVTTALATQIQTLTGLKMFPEMPDQINPPMGAILPGNPLAKYGITLGEGALFSTNPVPVPTDYNLVVGIFVSRAPSLQRAQKAVKEYLGMNAGASSVPRAILHDPTLGGIVEYCEPMTVTHFGEVNIAGQDYFQGRITVAISVVMNMEA